MKTKKLFLASILICIFIASCAPTKKNTEDGNKTREQREHLNKEKKEFEKTFEKH